MVTDTHYSLFRSVSLAFQIFIAFFYANNIRPTIKKAPLKYVRRQIAALWLLVVVIVLKLALLKFYLITEIFVVVCIGIRFVFFRLFLLAELRQHNDSKVYLFGSQAKGTANESSDIDLLIEKGSPMSLLKLCGFRQDVKDALGMDVDVVTTSGIEQAFRDAIAGTEVLLYEE